jgi:hypothetical protein
MDNFKFFVESRNASGLMNKDFSSMSLQQRMVQGRDIGESFIRNQLAQHGIEIKPAKDYHQDAKLKIDGFWNGEPVQIKLRRSGRNDSNDIAYEVVRNHNNKSSLSKQLENEHQQGRDWKGQVQHYFVMNRDETEIYHVSAKSLKNSISQAIQEMTSRTGGVLKSAFKSTNGVDLRPTKDPDPNSFTPFKVMAFVPVESVVDRVYPVERAEDKKTFGGNVTQQSTQQINPNWATAVDRAIASGHSSFPAPNNKKLLKPFERFAAKKGINVSIQNGQVNLKKFA